VKKNQDEKEEHFFKLKRHASSPIHKETSSELSFLKGVDNNAIPFYSVSGMHRDVVLCSYPSVKVSKPATLPEILPMTVQSFTLPFLTVFHQHPDVYNAAPGMKSASELPGKVPFVCTALCDYEVLGDNFDILINPTVMTKEQQRRSLHWFLLIAKKKLITFPKLPDEGAKADILDLDTTAWIPSPQDRKSFENDLDFHTVKILIKHLEFLAPYNKCVPDFIQHPYIKETSKKSVIINSDLVDASENSSEGMIKINNKIHEDFVPQNTHGNCAQKIVFGGDVLTNERAFSAQLNVKNGLTSFSQTAGIIHRPEGLHREMNFVLVTCTYCRHVF
jgi:hypothetical protein